MRISDDDQNYKDLDWYCVDGKGRVGHFASAGFKQIPPSVAESAEDLSFLHEFFNALRNIPDGQELDEHLAPEHRTERYLQSFVAMANRGLFSFDIETYLKPQSCYFRVAIPKFPLRFLDRPSVVSTQVNRNNQLFGFSY